MRQRTIFVLGMMLLTAAAWPQALATHATAPANAAAMLARLQELPRQLPGWQLTELLQTCDRTCLPQHLPLDAQTVLSYQYLWSVTVTFLASDPRQPVVLDVFAMADEVDAYGLYAQARHDQAVTAPVRTESYWTGDQLHLWRGRFYIRVTPKVTDALLRAATLALGEAVAATLPLPDTLPLMMRLMPQGRAKPQALHYYRRSILDGVTLPESLVNQYLQNDQPLEMALFRAPDEAATVPLLRQVTDLLRQGKTATPIGTLGQQAFVIQSSLHGLSYTMREGRYVALILDVHDRDTAEGLLRVTATNIRIVR